MTNKNKKTNYKCDKCSAVCKSEAGLEKHTQRFHKPQVGRPTKYRPEMVAVVKDFTERRQKAHTIPTIEGLSVELDLHIDTIQEWRNDGEHPEFSVAVSKMMKIQSDMMQTKALDGEYKHPMAIFLLKNNHGYRERTETDITTQGEKIDGITYLSPTGAEDGEDQS